MYDLIIKNGNIIDGSGGAAFVGDVAVNNGKIVRIDKNIEEASKQVLDASGLTVAPGFIDSHSHSDNALFDYPDMIEKIEQGITTSVAGQCGSSFAPDMNAAGEVVTFGQKHDALKEAQLGSNVVSFVGHGALRKTVVGYENRKPTAEEMEKMKQLLRDALENGAVGLSFGLIYTPSCYADTEELIELAKVVKEYDGLLSAHIRNENFKLLEAVDEFLTVIKAVNIKAVFSHHKSMREANWGKVNQSLKKIADAVAEGYDIYCDTYPYEASSATLSATLIDRSLRAMDAGAVAKMVTDAAIRAEIKKLYIQQFGASLSNLLLVQCKGHSEYEGMRIDAIANKRGQDDFDAAFDLLADSGATAKICNFSMCEEDIETVLKYERTMLCTDSSVAKSARVYHPRLRASFPRFLGKYVRERKVVSLPEAIRKCTFLPASVYGLAGKGLICEGYDADLCIFDAQRIIDKADYINCREGCEGLNYVLLGGEIVAENGVYNGKRNGKFIFA